MKNTIWSGILKGLLLFICGVFLTYSFGCGSKEDGNKNNNGNKNDGDNNSGGGDVVHTHTLIEHPFQEPKSCTGSGNYEYWECIGCGKFFYDSEGMNEYANKDDVFFTAKHSLHAVEYNAPTCTEKGNEAFWECYTCNMCFSDGDATIIIDKDDVWISELGHSYVSHNAANASCDILGWNKYHTCSRCSYTTQVKFYAPHKYLSNTYICEEKCGTSLIVTEGLMYKLNDDGQSYSVVGIGNVVASDIIIPYTYNDKPVTNIGQQAFKGCNSVTHIVIPSSVISIGKFAFENCSKLESIEIPNTVISIENSAFYQCISLQHIIIPSSVTKIEQYTFYGCRNLKCIEISNTIKSIDRSALEGCINLVRIDFYGTKLQWNMISKLDHWDSRTDKKYLVYCMDEILTAYGKNIVSSNY